MRQSVNPVAFDFVYGGERIFIQPSPDGWNFNVGYVTEGSYATSTAAQKRAKEYVRNRNADRIRSRNFPAIGDLSTSPTFR